MAFGFSNWKLGATKPTDGVDHEALIRAVGLQCRVGIGLKHYIQRVDTRRASRPVRRHVELIATDARRPPCYAVRLVQP